MFNIQTKNNDPEEVEVAARINELAARYLIPTFTKDILIEKGAMPHSHPLLTLNSRTKDQPLLILKTLIHEQFHWQLDSHPRFKECFEFLKVKYEYNDEVIKNGQKPSAFWIHIIVCFNTRNYLTAILSQTEIDWIYAQWSPYPETENLVTERFDEIKSDLDKFNLVYIPA